MINKSILSQYHVYIDEELVYELRYPGRVTKKNPTWSDRVIWMCPTCISRPAKITIKGVESGNKQMNIMKRGWGGWVKIFLHKPNLLVTPSLDKKSNDAENKSGGQTDFCYACKSKQINWAKRRSQNCFAYKKPQKSKKANLLMWINSFSSTLLRKKVILLTFMVVAFVKMQPTFGE